MKLLALTAILVSSLVYAQDASVKVNNIDAASNEGTTISVTKGTKAGVTKKYVITDGTDEINGDDNVLVKESQISWKKECKDWKQEFKDLNKENKIVSMSCGKMTCVKTGIEHKCTSVATYKVRVLAEE